jgi:ribonuclease R
MVLNSAKYGLFVELRDLFVEGLVPIETLPGDRFSYRENTREIVGAHTGRIYRAGDQVRVILDRVLAMERKLQFALVEGMGDFVGKAARKDCEREGGEGQGFEQNCGEAGQEAQGCEEGAAAEVMRLPLAARYPLQWSQES